MIINIEFPIPDAAENVNGKIDTKVKSR